MGIGSIVCEIGIVKRILRRGHPTRHTRDICGHAAKIVREPGSAPQLVDQINFDHKISHELRVLGAMILIVPQVI